MQVAVTISIYNAANGHIMGIVTATQAIFLFIAPSAVASIVFPVRIIILSAQK